MTEPAPKPQPAGVWDRWGRSVVQGALLLFIGFNVVSWLASQGRRQPELAVGTVAPVQSLGRLGGGQVAIGGATGRPVVLEFWATWCPACRRELPDLQALAEDWQGRGVTFLLVDLDDPGPERSGQVRAALDGLSVGLPCALDDGRVAQAYRVERLPYTVLLDRAGRIAGTWTAGWDEAALERLLERLLARK